jgi:signal transduction histidine kinase
MSDIEEVQRLRAEILRLQDELEQARVKAEDGAEHAQLAASEAQTLREDLRRIVLNHRAAEASVGDLRTRLSIVLGSQQEQSETRGAAEEELAVVVEELEALAEELEAANAALKQANAELDSRVAERTRELTMLNGELFEREQRLALAMRHARACSWDWQIETGVVSWSEECAELYGDAEIGTLDGWLSAVLPEDRQRLQSALQACAAEQVPEVAIDYRIAHSQKGERWLSSRGRLIRADGSGTRPAFISGLSNDITELKRAESLLEKSNAELSLRVVEAVAARESAQQQLFQKQKLEALGQLTGGVAHDFNNLLAVISNGLHLLAQIDDAGERAQLAERMLAAVDRGSALTRRLLTFGRRQALLPVVLDLTPAVAEFLELMRPSLPARIKIEGHVEAGTAPVFIDSGELQLALLNLCLNARDAMPRGGRIEIRARNFRVHADSASVKAGEYVEISVADCGHGMSADTLSHVFEPFFTTKDVGEGTGLGLAQVHGFVNQSGGAVHVSSKEGEGSVVTMLLPAAQSRTNPLAIPVPASGGAAPGETEGSDSALILMVEDDEELGPLVERMLRPHYRVRRVLTAHEALEYLRQPQAAVDLLFTDIRLPAGMDGLQLAAQVRELHPQLPIVVTSGYGGSLISEAVGMGLPILRKPYRFDELQSVLDSALRAGG